MQTLRASKLGLNPSLLSPAILDVLTTLTDAGFEAYIVGGGVRDLLLGLHPKDYDAVTNATPSQIKSVFGKRCRINGRRFELAHVYSGRDMIEVATFRAPPSRPNTTASGMVTRDNVWGTIQQDFVRRDFTINSLYYQPLKGQVLDF
ncbi:MAG: polynucleotide adenylyltransferase PcnB, partial [Flavobacteriales bacterium]